MKVAGRMVLGAVGILVFGVVVVVWGARTSLRDSLEFELRVALQEEAGLIQDALPEDPGAWPRLVGRWAADRGHAVTILDGQGRPLADNRLAPGVLGTLGPMADLPEVREARAGRVGHDLRIDEGEPLRLFVAIPGNPIVRVATDLEVVETAVSKAQRSVVWAGLVALLVGALLAWLAGRTLSRPLTQLASAARSLPAGSLPRLPRSGIPEIDQLTDALRQTQQELAARFEALRAERAGSEALVDAMVEGVLGTDAKGRILTANPAARRLLGYRQGESLPDLPQLFRAKGARQVVEASLKGEPVQDREVELDGRALLVNARPLAAGGVVLVLHDVTQLRRLEAVRRDFVANVSHELKTPLTSVSGYAETLLTEDLDQGTRAQFLRTILANASRMQQLVDDQLDLARIESGRWQANPRRLVVADAARESWASRAAAAESAGIRFGVDVAPGAEAVHADPQALSQILGNLFDNAIRHTPGGGAITSAARREGGGVAISVSDTGAG
ncbi:MAG TPA: histidine kinase dimerization/phospho-acceptor domain-containing protein, partial [Gemmatimonadales bacterium]|nr:histidine kinase dimerization/phospho-acceptor domain-containing protein [Gemmatimonadales bacterium]